MLKSANLAANDIGDAGAIAISTALESNTTFTDLDLQASSFFESGKISATGAQAIAKMLAVNRALTSVNLLQNDLGDGAAAVVAAAKKHGKIKTLCGIKEGQDEADLSYNVPRVSVSDAVLLSFDLEFNGSLKSAYLDRNGIGDEGAIAISEALKTNSTLTELGLGSYNDWTNKIGPAGAQALADMLEVNRSLNSINLLNNNLGGGAAAIVAAAKRQGNIKTLCGIEKGKSKVSFNQKGLKAPDAVLLGFDLEFNKALTSLNLRQNEIGAGGAKAIADSLPKS